MSPEISPVFVVGMPRSGTTLVSTMISAHPQLTIPPETHYLNEWVQRHRYFNLERDGHFLVFWNEFARSERFTFFDVDSSSALNHLRTKPHRTFKTVFESLLECHAMKVGKARWGEKTPAHFEHLDTLLTWYPFARILYMIRDPRAVAASMKRVPWGSKHVDPHALRWQRSAKILAQWQHDERVLGVSYESLVTEPTKTLKTICAHLNVEFTASMLLRSGESNLTINRTGWAMDHFQKALQPVTSKNVDKWRMELDRNEIAVVETLTHSGMETFGYSPNNPRTPGRQLVRRRIWQKLRRLVSAPSKVQETVKRSAAIPTILLARHSLVKLLSRSKKALMISTRLVLGSRNARGFDSLKDYFRPQSVTGYIGWLHHANVGDEVLFLAFQKLFPHQFLLSYNSVLPLEMHLYRGLIRRAPLFNFVFLGGGTLINDPGYLRPLRRARTQGLPIIVFGSGVRDPAFWSPQYSHRNTYRDVAAWKGVLNEAEFVAVRGPQSAAILKDWGVEKIHIIGDPALSLVDPEPVGRPFAHRVGLNLGGSGPIWGSMEQVVEKMAALVPKLVERGYQIEYISMHPIDDQLGQRLNVTIDMDIPIWKGHRNLSTIFDRFKRYDLVIAQRLHAIVISHGLGIPAIALEYRPKVSDFMESMEQEALSFRTDRLDIVTILESVEIVERDYENIRRTLIKRGNELRFAQLEAARKVMRLIDSP